MKDSFGQTIISKDICLIVKNNKPSFGYFVRKFSDNEGLFDYIFNKNSEDELKIIRSTCNSSEVVKFLFGNETPEHIQFLMDYIGSQD